MNRQKKGRLRLAVAFAVVALAAAAAGAGAAWSIRMAQQAPAEPAAREPAPPAPGTALQAVFRERVPAARIREAAAALFDGFALPEIRFDVDTFDLLYSSTDFDGSSIVVKAQLFVPSIPDSSERPLYVFGSGTTGNADQCAPSLEQLEHRVWGHYRAYMLAHAGVGFIGALPDYAGFNDPDRPQRYFSKSAEAHVMLDAVRASRASLAASPQAARLSGAVFLAGYSQGGHAALASADLRAAYAPDVEIAGVVGFAAAADVGALFRDGPAYAPYVLHSYSQIYGLDAVDPGDYLLERWAGTLEADAARMCVDEFQRYYGRDGRQLFQQSFYEALHGGTLERDFPVMASILSENGSGTAVGAVPVLVVQGGADTIVTADSQDRFVERLRRAGTPVTYLVLKGIPHRHTRAAAFGTAVEWMERIARGEPAPAQPRQ